MFSKLSDQLLTIEESPSVLDLWCTLMSNFFCICYIKGCALLLFSAELCGARLLEDSYSAGANVWHKSSVPGPEL